MPRDVLDRYYTPDALADACVQRLRWAYGLRSTATVVEPSVGGGAWVRALLRHGVGAVDGYDLDADAPGLGLCARATVGDWVQAKADERTWDWAVGNPPYRHTDAHVAAALLRASNVAMLLRVGWLCGQRRSAMLRAHVPSDVVFIRGRPSFTEDGGADTSEYAMVIWRAGASNTTHAEWLSWR
jgi:hypothetical protein